MVCLSLLLARSGKRACTRSAGKREREGGKEKERERKRGRETVEASRQAGRQAGESASCRGTERGPSRVCVKLASAREDPVVYRSLLFAVTCHCAHVSLSLSFSFLSYSINISSVFRFATFCRGQFIHPTVEASGRRRRSGSSQEKSRFVRSLARSHPRARARVRFVLASK